MVITYNEAMNIGRTLEKLRWASNVVVVDSGSDDGTLATLRSYPNVHIVHQSFTDFASQCNLGLRHIRSPWVLSLDADYELSDALIAELRSLQPGEGIAAYRARFIYRIHGRPLRGTLYPPRVVLYRTNCAVYRNEGHGHRVQVSGQVSSLAAPIYHDDRKSLTRWFKSQQVYARTDAEHLLTCNPATLSLADRIRLAAWPAPFAILFYTLFFKGCVLDGWAGWFYALQRLLAETLLALEIIDRRLGFRKP